MKKKLDNPTIGNGPVQKHIGRSVHLMPMGWKVQKMTAIKSERTRTTGKSLNNYAIQLQFIFRGTYMKTIPWSKTYFMLNSAERKISQANNY